MPSRLILWNEIICNLFVYAGQVPLSRVHFDPKQESDCLENFKIICSTFRKLDVDKVIDNMLAVYAGLLSRVWMSTGWWSWSSKTTCFSSTGSRISLTRRPRSKEGYRESENVYLIQNLDSAVITQLYRVYIVMSNIFPTPSESKVFMIR